MSQRYPDINSPQFRRQARSTLVELMLTHLPVGIDGRKIDDCLVCRLGYLRKKLNLVPLPGDKHVGPFHCRPPFQWMLAPKPSAFDSVATPRLPSGTYPTYAE
jgi:hypothetical protein